MKNKHNSIILLIALIIMQCISLTQSVSYLTIQKTHTSYSTQSYSVTNLVDDDTEEFENYTIDTEPSSINWSISTTGDCNVRIIPYTDFFATKSVQLTKTLAGHIDMRSEDILFPELDRSGFVQFEVETNDSSLDWIFTIMNTTGHAIMEIMIHSNYLRYALDNIHYYNIQAITNNQTYVVICVFDSIYNDISIYVNSTLKISGLSKTFTPIQYLRIEDQQGSSETSEIYLDNIQFCEYPNLYNALFQYTPTYFNYYSLTSLVHFNNYTFQSNITIDTLSNTNLTITDININNDTSTFDSTTKNSYVSSINFTIDKFDSDKFNCVDFNGTFDTNATYTHFHIYYYVYQIYTEYYKITGLFDDSQYDYILILFNIFIVVILTIGIAKRLELNGQEYLTLFIMDFMMLSGGFNTEMFYLSIVIATIFLIFKIRSVKQSEV